MSGFKASAGLVLLLLCAACHRTPAPKPADSEVAPPPTAASVTASAAVAPADETDLVKQIAEANAKPKTGDFCTYFQTISGFNNWVGQISDFRTSTVNGSIDLTIDLGSHVSLEQVIQTSDPLYATVQALRVGGTVVMSGRFSHGNGECDYALTPIGAKLSQIRGA